MAHNVRLVEEFYRYDNVRLGIVSWLCGGMIGDKVSAGWMGNTSDRVGNINMHEDAQARQYSGN